MGTRWGLTLDCARPAALAEFRAFALGYEPGPVPAGFASCDPAGAAPTLSLRKVPESKVVKNRLHVDIKAGGREPEGNEFCVV